MKRNPPHQKNQKKKNVVKNILTREKILELQIHNYIEIKNFIFSLPIYGTDVSLERFTPNGSKYAASKLPESLIKIQISDFCKRVNEMFNVEQNLKMKNNINIINNNNYMDSEKSSNIKDLLNSPLTSTHSIPAPPPPSNQNEEINKGIISDSSSTLIFNKSF